MSSLVKGVNFLTNLNLHSDGQRAQLVALPAASQPSAVSPDPAEPMDSYPESAPGPATRNPLPLSQGAPVINAAETQLAPRRRAALTHNTHATQFNPYGLE